MDPQEQAKRIQRSLADWHCAWCEQMIPGWPDTKGVGDNQHGRFCGPACFGSMHGAEFLKKHQEILKRSYNN